MTTILMRYKTTVHSFDEVQNDSAILITTVHSFDEVQNGSADTLLMRYKTTVQTLCERRRKLVQSGCVGKFR